MNTRVCTEFQLSTVNNLRVVAKPGLSCPRADRQPLPERMECRFDLTDV